MIRLFKHYIPKGLLVLGSAEFALFMISVFVGGWIRFDGSFDLSEETHPTIAKAVLFSLVMLGSMMAVGLYQRHLRDGRLGMLLRLGVAFGAGFVVMSLLFYLFPDTILGRGVFAYAFGFAILSVFLSRLVYLKLVHRDNLKKRILVIGAGRNANLIERRLKRRTDRGGFMIVGYVDLPGEKNEVAPELIVRPDVSLVEYAQLHDIDEMVVAVTDRRNKFPVEELLDCKMSGIEIVDLLTFFERQAGRVLLEILNPSWMIYSDGFSQGVVRDFSKRAFDIVASVALLIPTLPIMLLTAILVYLEDRGPVFYKQVRVGQNWKLFRVVKFRSMRVDAEKDGAKFAKKNDDRVTRIGNFIRKTRIDELPQLFNVLRGDMSFVGPRPERPEFVEKFSQTIPYYSERHRVKPGVTGWAQISYPYGASEEDTVEKLQFDLYYVKNYSLFLDLTVLLMTAEVILWGKGAR